MSGIVEAWRNAAVFGAVAVVLAVAAAPRRAWRWYPVLVGAGVGAAYLLHLLDGGWALQSLRADAPWMLALVLALWSAHASSAWLRASAWPAVVIGAALLGDRFVAFGLALAEPDPARRARLVLAASGASLVGVTSGAASLVLGWAGPEAVVVGLVLAGVGFVRGGSVGVAAPGVRASLAAVVVPILGAVVAWLAIVGGALEYAATGLENIPLLATPRADLGAYGAAVLAGAIGDEGIFALFAHEIGLRALALRGDTIPLALQAGLAVGGGLPLLLLTRSSLRVGLPLWSVQIGIVLAWLALR